MACRAFFWHSTCVYPGQIARRTKGVALAKALKKRDTGSWIEVTGFVTRLLSNDNDGSRHQRFVIDIGNRLTLLIAHNIDLASPVPVGIGDRVYVRGMYEWNDLGGLVHWTHDDPHGVEDGGYVRYRRQIFR